MFCALFARGLAGGVEATIALLLRIAAQEYQAALADCVEGVGGIVVCGGKPLFPPSRPAPAAAPKGVSGCFVVIEYAKGHAWKSA